MGGSGVNSDLAAVRAAAAPLWNVCPRQIGLVSLRCGLCLKGAGTRPNKLGQSVDFALKPYAL